VYHTNVVAINNKGKDRIARHTSKLTTHKVQLRACSTSNMASYIPHWNPATSFL